MDVTSATSFTVKAPVTMSIINVQQNHKNDLKILRDQPDQVISDFCRLSANVLNKGSNIKLYQVASQKLGVSVSQVQSAVEGLIFLYLEAYRNELSEELFREVVISLDFKEESAKTLYNEFISFKSVLDKALPQTSVVFPQYSNLSWRFEAQVSSKTIRNEIIPKILMKLDLEKGNKTESLCIQSDIPNIIHMSQTLNQALEESKTNHSRRVQKMVT